MAWYGRQNWGLGGPPMSYIHDVRNSFVESHRGDVLILHYLDEKDKKHE